MNILCLLVKHLCKDFLRKNSELIFLTHKYITPLVLQGSMLHDLPHLRSKQLFDGNLEILDPHYECPLKLQASETCKKQAAS